MSLLLDALKKAAEQKARKNEDKSAGLDATETSSRLSVGRRDISEMTETMPLTRPGFVEQDTVNLDVSAMRSALNETETSIEATHIDQTAVDHTELDATSIDATELDATDILETLPGGDQTSIEAAHIDQTVVDHTELDATDLDETDILEAQPEVDEPSAEATHIDQTVVDHTQLDSTSIDATDLDATDIIEAPPEVDHSSIEATHIDYRGIEHTELDANMIDATDLVETDIIEALPEVDETSIEATHIDKTAVDHTDLDATDILETRPEANETSIETTHIDQLAVDHTEQDASEIDALQIDDSTETRSEANRFTAIDSTHTDHPSMDDEPFEMLLDPDDDDEDEEYLTEADVTSFMGDGLTDEDIIRSRNKKNAPLSPDDTTLTNSEALELTNFGYQPSADEDFSLVDDRRRGDDTDSIRDWDEDSSKSISFDSGRARAIESGSDTYSTATSPSFDIDRLTNDQTVTVEGRTTTKTFAPDNYDRTLLNMSDRDVSRIFPGMKSDSDAVMTPDYAKKIFLSRSSQLKTHYYTLYAGVALLLLLGVVFWGLIELQQESELIDQKMVGLKRDPMPGIIKPNTGATAQPLFEIKPVDSDIKALNIIAQADQTAQDPVQKELTQQAIAGAEQAAEKLQAKPLQDVSAESVEADESGVEAAAESSAELSPQRTASVSASASRADSSPTATKTASKAKATAGSSLQLTSSNQPNKKDLLLVEAYQAYEQGDMIAAKKQYEQVLSLDQTSRDAILGRAAIHVQDNEFPQAIRRYQQLLEANPKDSMAMTSLISVANIEPQAGESQLKKLLREQPETAYLHFALGNIYSAQSRWQEAQKAYFDALQYNPAEPNYAYNMAVSLEHMGKPSAAIGFYQKALQRAGSGLATFDSQRVIARIEVLTQ